MITVPVFVLVLFFWTDVTSYAAHYDRRFCDKHDTSCSYQLWKNNPELEKACHMTYIKWGSEQCNSLSFNVEVSTRKHLGDVRLQTYPEIENNRTLFNLTYSNILWKQAKMRFIQENKDVSDEEITSSCRIFNIWSHITVPEDAQMYYDCSWAYTHNEGREVFIFEHEGSSGGSVDYKKFMFYIPRYEKVFGVIPIEQRELFLYVERTNLPFLRLRLQPLPSSYNVTNYKIQVLRRRHQDLTYLDLRFISPANTVNDEIIFDFNTWNEWGYYYFMVSFISADCPEDRCAYSVSPEIYIERKASRLVIGIVGASLIIPILFFAICVWNRQCNVQDFSSEDSKPKVLLIYTPSTKLHDSIIINLTYALRDAFDITVFLDRLDISQTDHKDPLRWCSESFENATHIVFVMSPETSDYPTIYETEAAAMRFLEEEIKNRNFSKQIATIVFQHTTKNIPETLRRFRCFNLMKDFHKFLQFITNKWQSPWVLWTEDMSYLDLLEDVKAAENYKPVKNELKIPQIKLSATSKENVLLEQKEDDAKYVKEQGPFSFDINELNLSGGEEEEEEVLRPKTPTENYSFNIQSLNM